MGSNSFLFVAASADGMFYADATKHVELAMYNLKDRPIEVRGGRLVLFEKLVYVEEFLTFRQAEHAVKVFNRKSRKKKLDLIHQINPDLKDISAAWFPVAAAARPSLDFDFPGGAQGGITAKLPLRIPPRTAQDAVDPCAVMSYEELLACGALKELAVGSPRSV